MDNLFDFFFGTTRRVGYTLLGCFILWCVVNLDQVSAFLQRLLLVLVNDTLPVIFVLLLIIWALRKVMDR